jgi:hypothetical protein
MNTEKDSLGIFAVIRVYLRLSVVRLVFETASSGAAALAMPLRG